MKDKNVRNVYVHGSSALKPDCSYSNENEHIITFPVVRTGTVQPKVVKRPSVGNRKGGIADCVDFLGSKSSMIAQARTESIMGSPLKKTSRKKTFALSALYAGIALAALYFGA